MKLTPPEHVDYQNIQHAYEIAQDLAVHVNESKKNAEIHKTIESELSKSHTLMVHQNLLMMTYQTKIFQSLAVTKDELRHSLKKG